MIEKIKAKLIFLLRLYLLRDKQYIAYKKWVKENPNEEARYDYYLSKSSLVFDVGGYHGEFSEKIYDKYKCYIHIFEPYPDFFEIINKKFKNRSKIKCKPIGLSNTDTMLPIVYKGLGTFLQNEDSKNGKKVSIKNISNYLAEHNIERINLLKLNVEGSEYEILQELINSKLIGNIENIQVQFHKRGSKSEAQYYELRDKLRETHHLTYHYFMIWENWSLN